MKTVLVSKCLFIYLEGGGSRQMKSMKLSDFAFCHNEIAKSAAISEIPSAFIFSFEMT
jgi:hypothetical protein